MYETFDDYPDTGLEEILLGEQNIADFEHIDTWREEIDLGIAEVKGDLYSLHADEYREEIEKCMDEFRGERESDDCRDWRKEVDRAIDREQQE